MFLEKALNSREKKEEQNNKNTALSSLKLTSILLC